MKRALEEADEGKGKRGRKEGVDDVEEFFAVLKRIEATKKELGYININKKPFSPAAQAVTSKLPWRLSFEWEDFCSNGNGSRDVTQNSASVADEANFKQGNRLTDDDNKQRFGCVRQNNKAQVEDATERLDLNLPSNPAGLHLFF